MAYCLLLSYHYPLMPTKTKRMHDDMVPLLIRQLSVLPLTIYCFCHFLLTTRYSPLSTHNSLQPTRDSRLTTHDSRLTAHDSWLMTHDAWLTSLYSLLTTHHPLIKKILLLFWSSTYYLLLTTTFWSSAVRRVWIEWSAWTEGRQQSSQMCALESNR